MFRGSITALVTPMAADGTILFNELSDLVEWQISQGTHGLVAVGTTGEAGTLEPQEQLQIIRHVVKSAKGKVPVIAGASAVATHKVIQLATNAMEAGVDGCLIMSPPYVKPTQEGLYQHYQQIALQVGLPIILYNIPGRTASDLLPETIARLAKISNIIGIKEASGKLERVTDILQQCGAELDVFGGEDIIGCASMLLGAKGVISVTANIAPFLMSQMCASALAGEFTATRQYNDRLHTLHHALFWESNPIPVKWALQQMQKISSGLRLPLLPLSTHYQQSLQQLLKQAELL